MLRHRIAALLAALALCWSPAAWTPAAADQRGDAELLARLLGDPAAIGKDYGMLGNSAALRSLLPGRWMMLGWDMASGLLAEDKLAKACEKGGYDIAPSARDGLSFTAMASRKGERFEVFDLVWTGGSTFVQVRNLAETLAHLGLDPAKQGLGPSYAMIRSATVPLALLPLSPDTLLAVASDRAVNTVMLRCPAA